MLNCQMRDYNVDYYAVSDYGLNHILILPADGSPGVSEAQVVSLTVTVKDVEDKSDKSKHQ